MIEYAKNFSDNEINILHLIRFGQLPMDVMREQLIDFFNENPCGLEEKHNDYSMCNDEEILERLNLDLKEED